VAVAVSRKKTDEVIQGDIISQIFFERAKMKNCKQIVIGIQPATKMFRLSSLGGQVIDAILEKRDSSKILGPDYYNSVSSRLNGSELALTSEDKGNVLQLHQDNIVFKKSFYNSEKHFHIENVLEEFREIWKVINKIIVMKNIRRIGIAGETRFPSTNPSLNLLKNVTKLTTQDHCDRFNLHYERMKLAKDGAVPDRKKSDFLNVITDLYDSVLDTENPADGCININVDVQRYYAPLISDDVAGEVLKLYNNEYMKTMGEAQQNLVTLGLLHA